LDDLCAKLATDPTLVTLQQEVQADGCGDSWTVGDELVTHRGCIFLPAASPSLSNVLLVVHGTEHEGVQKMLHQLQ
jgi:hypothetical protein